MHIEAGCEMSPHTSKSDVLTHAIDIVGLSTKNVFHFATLGLFIYNTRGDKGHCLERRVSVELLSGYRFESTLRLLH